MVLNRPERTDDLTCGSVRQRSGIHGDADLPGWRRWLCVRGFRRNKDHADFIDCRKSQRNGGRLPEPSEFLGGLYFQRQGEFILDVLAADEDGSFLDRILMKTAKSDAHGLLLMNVVSLRISSEQVVEVETQRLKRNGRRPRRNGNQRLKVSLEFVGSHVKQIKAKLAVARIANRLRC